MRSFNIALFALALVASCGSPTSDVSAMCVPYHNEHYADQFPGKYAYDVQPNTATAKGIEVDTSGLTVNVNDLLDRQLDEMEACLIKAFGNPIVLPPEVAAQAQCLTNTFAVPFPRSCLTVKVADNWICSQSTDPNFGGSQEMLPSPGPEAGCNEKGLCLDASGQPIPADQCGCSWRAGIQANSYVIVPPTAYLFKDAASRWFTGCNAPWSEPHFAACIHPTVPPLPAGQTMCIPPGK